MSKHSSINAESRNGLKPSFSMNSAAPRRPFAYQCGEVGCDGGHLLQAGSLGRRFEDPPAGEIESDRKVRVEPGEVVGHR